MPSADQVTLDKMKEHFGGDDHSVWELRAQEHLREQGYKEERFMWHPKLGVKTVQDMTEKEYVALWYLITEWDWGGLISD